MDVDAVNEGLFTNRENASKVWLGVLLAGLPLLGPNTNSHLPCQLTPKDHCWAFRRTEQPLLKLSFPPIEL